MQDQVFQFLSELPLFSELPENELSRLVADISVMTYPKSTILSVQGRTKLDCVYIIKEGLLELFYESDGEREIKGFLKPGDIFGGISILMNAGISVRTVQVVDDAMLYHLPQKVFLDACTRHKYLYEYFAEKFSKRMSDESYASVVATGQAVHFLSHLVPFSFLPEDEINTLAADISVINYPKDTVLFVQGLSQVEYLYII